MGGFARSIALVVTAAVLCSGVAACGNSPQTSTSTASASASASNPYGSPPPVDPPGPSEPILRLTPLGGAPLTLSLDALAAYPQQVITIEEPFVKKRQEFTGVRLADLLTKAGIPESAKINTIALNEYAYAAPATQFTDSDALIAYRVDGHDIDITEGGPVRIVFPEGSPQFSDLDAWTWSLAQIVQE